MKWYRLVLALAFAILLLLTCSLLGEARKNPVAVGFIGTTAALLGVLTYRGSRAATLTISPSEVIIRTLLRTRRVPLDQIRDVGVGHGSSAALIPWRVPEFLLVDGSTIRADEIRSLREPSVVDAVVDACLAQIARRRV